jgi:hypothetical protein
METSAVQALKLTLVQNVGLSKDALHIYIGLFVFVIASVVQVGKKASAYPLFWVAVAAVSGELLDMRDDLRTLGYWRWSASLHDFLNTTFWPLVLTVLLRLRAIS